MGNPDQNLEASGRNYRFALDATKRLILRG
jgi:hypothetical protein